jgi:tetratricopeptide (TPR) repeat protein
MSDTDENRSPPAWKRFFAELKRRRVFRVMAVYGGSAFAVLEAVDLISSGIPIPSASRSVLTVLVLAGFPIAVALSWVFDITPGGVRRTDPARKQDLDDIVAQSARARWPAGILALVGSGLFLAAAWTAADRLGWLDQTIPREAYAVEDPLGSYVVLPFEHRAETPEERALAEQASSRLARQLRGWESVRVVPDFALAGALHDLGVESSVLPSLDVGLQVARAQRVGTLLALTTEIYGDTAVLEVLLYDVSGGHEVRRPIQITAPVSDIDGLVAPVTLEILQLRDFQLPLGTLLTESSSPHALREFQAGLDALYAWRLPEAEEHFREAIAADSSFALPVHYLGLTLYWTTSRNPERIVDLGPEIDRLTRSADALAAERGLRPGLRDHVSAFRAFWEGDYDAARDKYREVLASDSTDVEAWLLLGAVEFEDPWLVELQDGSLKPRKSLNLSRTSFETAARLAPELPLSYGQLFEIDKIVAEAVIQGECPAYERPGGDLFPPFANRVAGDQVAFCPVPEDSIVWIPLDDYASADRAGHVQSTRDLLARTSTLLERWIAVRPDQARPHEEWADFTLWERDLADCRADPARVDSLTGLALRHTELALELRGDTTPADRVRLAILRLAADDIESAERLMETALSVYGPARPDGPPPPTAAANLYLATGRPDRAHTILRPVWDERTFGAMDPDAADGFVMAGPVEPQFGRLLLYGATGAAGPALDSAFASIEEVWSEPDFTWRQRAALSNAALHLGIGPSLAASPAVLERWVAEWMDTGLDVPAVLIGLAAVQSGTGSAEAWLDSTVVQLEASDRISATRLFLAATLAARTGQDSLAAELFGRVPACPPGLDSVDLAWGLRTQSHLFQGLAYQSIGDREAAARTSREAARLWQSAEATLAPAVRLASESAESDP